MARAGIRRIGEGAQAAKHRLPGACRGLPPLGRGASARASTSLSMSASDMQQRTDSS